MTLFRRASENVSAAVGKMYPLAPGEVISLESIKDQIISSLIVGNGYAVVPSENNVYSPLKGTVRKIANNGRAITVVSHDGIIAVIHLGTVMNNARDLKETVLKVNVGDEIAPGQLICQTDISAAIKDGRDITLMMIISNFEKLKSFDVRYGNVENTDTPILFYDI